MATMYDPHLRRVCEMLERVYREAHPKSGPLSSDRKTHDFVFHMTDWADDLKRLADLYAKPNGSTLKDWEDATAGFFIHVLGHLLAATKLAGWDISDPFKVLKKPKQRKASRRRRATALM